ncbi:MAG: TolC family protein [Pseudomonadota bacterium]
MLSGHRTRKSLLVAVLAVVILVISPKITSGDERGLTLEQAIRQSLATPRVLAAREAVTQARADVDTASLLPNPSLAVEAGMLPLSRTYTVDEPGGPPELSGGISFPLDWLLFGKRSAAVSSAESAVSVAEAEYADIVRQRIAETTEAFYDVLEAGALLEAARQAVADLEQAEAAIGKAVANGGRPQMELSRVRLEFQSAKREERSTRAALISAKAKLRALVGLATATTAPLRIEGTLEGTLAAAPLSVEAAFTTASESRPDIVALRKKVAKARGDEVVEGRNAWPETSLGFGVAHQFQESVGAPDATAWGLSLEIALPFFDRNQGGRAKAAAATVQANHELTAALADLRADVEQAVQVLGTAYENAIEMTQTDLDLASQVRDSFRKSYEAGGRPLLEMLDAQRSYRETYRAYVSTRAEYWRALARYEAAIGRKVSP